MQVIDQPILRRLLLALASPVRPADPERLAAMTAADWLALDALAVQHRMQPLLHSLHASNPAVPDEVRSLWHAAWRDAAMAAMILRADLQATVRTLRASGIEPLVMKGGWLAWHGYAHPAERPMRDLDLLIPAGRIGEAVEVLHAAGYAWAEQPDMPLEELFRIDKSLPGLIAPRGTEIELHIHAWHPSGRLEYPSPEPDNPGMFARSRLAADGLTYPSAEDMLAHLIIHATYSHRLDCGPLVLSDIAALLAKDTIDWPAFWERTRREGWQQGARLVLELVRHWRAPGGLDLSADSGKAPPPALLEAGADLLLQDMQGRFSAGLFADILAAGPSALWRRVRRRVGAPGGEGATIVRPSAREGNYLVWAISRLRRTLGDVLNREMWRQSRDIAMLIRHISRPET